ncbi:MAG: ribbon-helix-helix domain-containing protein [Clostridiales bacterium]
MSVPENKIKMSTNLDKELYKKLKELSKKEGRHMNYFIEKGIKRILKEHENVKEEE